MSSSELVQRLRAADAALASMSPSAQLEGRIRARALGLGAGRIPSLLAGARRLHRPLILAFATAAALLLVVASRGRGGVDPAMVAGGPEDPSEPIVNDRIHADGGPAAPARGDGPPPVFHMPALEPGPSRSDHPLSAPTPLSPPPAPSASTPAAIQPLPVTPLTLRDEVDDRGRHPARVEASRPAVASVGRAAGPIASPAASTFRPSFVARGGGEVVSKDVSPSSSPGGNSPVAAVDCKSPSALREIALAKCESTGVDLATFTFLEPCGGGQFGSISFACASPEPEVKPDPKPEPDQCVHGSFEGGTSCVDLGGYDKDPLAGVEKEATVACAQQGLLLSALSVDAVECAAQSGKVTYVCCPAALPGPAPDTCHDDKVGADTCVDLATLEAKASTLCAQSGQVLSMISPLAGCSDGQASTAMISCCPPSP